MTKTCVFRNTLGAIVVAILFLSNAPAQAQDHVTPSKLDQAQKSATNLYLMRTLDHTLMTWKPATANPAELGAWILVTRNRLVVLKKTAEVYGLDAHIIRAYGDALDLLKEYEQFLKDIVYFDLTANIAKPEQKSFTDGLIDVGSGGLSGAALGSGVPIVGNLVGAGVGASAAGLKLLSEYRETISTNEKIDAQVRAAKVQLIDRLGGHFATTDKGMKTLAEELGGKKKYGWGSEVGFDGSERMSYEEQLRLRPNDAFLYAAMAIQEAHSNPKLAAKRLTKAAQLVPQDTDREVHIFDLDRAEFLLTAARIAEYGARQGGKDSAELAAQSVACYRAACKCVKKGDETLPRDLKLVYARACALAGLPKDAEEVMEKLLKQSANDPWLYYEYAGVKSMLREPDSALEYLRRSIKAQPRWQPNACWDSRFAALNSTQKAEIERICANPLVGKWTGKTGTNDLVLEFYPDGSMRQTIGTTAKTGTYEELKEGTINLKSQKTTSFKYSVTKTELTLTSSGKTYELNRSVPRLLGTWKFKDGESFEFRDDGTYRAKKGDSVTTGTYYVISPKEDAGRELRWVRDNAVLAEFAKRAEYRFTDEDTLEVKRWGEKDWHEYKRQQ